MDSDPEVVEPGSQTAAAARDWSPPDEWFVAVISAAISVAAWIIYWRRGDLLLYGDAVAHIGIARRVLDSLTPGFAQLGTVWLPLPHVLMLPFVAPLAWWHAGAAASFPSMLAYICACVGIFRLTRCLARGVGLTHAAAAAALATLLFGANPNLLYLQATAMTEALYLALMIWATAYLAEFATAPSSRALSLVAAGAAFGCAELTRYDAWLIAPLFVAVGLILAKRRAAPRLVCTLFVAIIIAGPLFWMGWNWKATGSPTDFATGPYSARGIEQRVKATIDARDHPGEGEPIVALRYFAGDAQLNLGEKRWGRALFWIAVLSTLCVVLTRRSFASALLVLLWAPLGVYTYSIAYGSVPIFTPIWWPYSYYNVRYGIELLPAIAVACGLLTALGMTRVTSTRARAFVFLLALAYGAGAYQSCWFQQPNRPKSLLPGEPWLGPISWREAVTNARTRVPFERRLAHDLRMLPRAGRILMFTGDHIGALQDAGIPLARVVNEGNWPWWQMALENPAEAADYIVAMEGDAVAQAVSRNFRGLEEVTTIHLPGQPRTVIFRSTLRRRLTPGLRASAADRCSACRAIATLHPN